VAISVAAGEVLERTPQLRRFFDDAVAEEPHESLAQP
jgi:hypothetical protein